MRVFRSYNFMMIFFLVFLAINFIGYFIFGEGVPLMKKADAGAVNGNMRYAFVDSGTDPIYIRADPKVESYFYGADILLSETQSNTGVLKISIDNHRGPAFDYVLYEAEVTTDRLVFEAPGNPGWYLENGDAVIFEYPNLQESVFGVRVIVGNRRP